MRAQLTALEKDQKTRATRFQRDVVDRALVDVLSVYRDVLVVQAGDPVDLVNEEMRTELTRLARDLTPGGRRAADGGGSRGPRADRGQRRAAAGGRGDGGAAAVGAVRRRLVAAVCLVVTALTLSACRAAAPGPTTSSNAGWGAKATPTQEAGVAADLQRYYMQRLTWRGCRDGYQCSTLTVPMDYADTSKRDLHLALIRLPASSQHSRIGSLVINPGGPGGSGVQYARNASSGISDAVRKRYDIIGFDPRGVGASDPIRCLTDAQTDQFFAADPTPTTATEIATAVRIGQDFADDCEAKNAAQLPFVGTRDAARDMDILRAALGEQKLTYLGKSYGTFLGATYADEFPTKVGRMVLDGVIDPKLTSEQINLGQAQGFELATRSFMADCVKRSGCPMGSDMDAGMAKLQGLIAGLDADPLPTKHASRPLTEGLGTLGVAYALYDKSYWPYLRAALQQAVAGQGQGLLALADAYSGRDSGGHYSSNLNDALYAVNCIDRAQTGGIAQIEQDATTFTATAPTWGGLLAWGSLPCLSWPVKPTDTPHAITATGSGPIVVVGTTRDPATPYAWAQGLASELADGHLITYDGDGHTAYREGSSCVDTAVDSYLLKGAVPPAGKRC